MDFSLVIDQFSKQASNVSPIGAKIKFVLDDQALLIDGTGEENKVTAEDAEADCTITTSLEILQKLQKGELNPMMAVMSGKIKISGDMGLAMKLQSLI